MIFLPLLGRFSAIQPRECLLPALEGSGCGDAHHGKNPQNAHARNAEAEEDGGEIGQLELGRHGQRQSLGQLPAEGQHEAGQTGDAQKLAVRRFRQPERPHEAGQEEQHRQHLPHHDGGRDAVPAGAVLHETAQHAPVEHQRAPDAGGHTLCGRLPVLPQPALRQLGQPLATQNFQYRANKRACASHSNGEAQKSCGSKECPCHRRDDAGRFAVVPQFLRPMGQLSANADGRQHAHGQRGIAQPDRADGAQAAFQIGPEAKVQRAADGQRSSYNEQKFDPWIHQRSSIGLYFWRTPRYL